MKRLPDFFVVGAQKAGTTSLHDWLVQQPDICLPTLKETQFFSFEWQYCKGIDWYLEQFPSVVAASVVGEVCPDYMYFAGTPERIRECCSNPKIIFIFRHPIDRAYSHYRMKCREGIEQLSFYEALTQEEKRLASNEEYAQVHFSYASRGEYTKQVAAFYDVFKDAKIHFVKFDDLIDKGRVGSETYAQICRFIGVNSSPKLAQRQKKSNAASEPRSTWIRNLLYRPNGFKRIIGKMIPSQALKELIAVKVDKLNQRSLVTEGQYTVPKKILEQAREEIVKLQEITQLDLEDWLQKDYQFE